MKKTKTESKPVTKPKLMTWRKAATTSAAITCWAAASHYYAGAWVLAEQKLVDKYNSVKFEIAEAAAESIGYAKPEPVVIMNELETLDYATNKALEAGVNPAVIRAKIKAESAGHVDAVSAKGAQGLMQVMPVNAYRCGLSAKELKDPRKNIACGIQLFKEDLIATGWNLWPAIERYNGGPNCVGNKCHESIEHARKVLKYLVQDLDEKPVPEYYTVAEKAQLDILVEKVGG